MKTIEYISPTRVNMWRRDPEQFYLKYLSDAAKDLPKDPQTQPMAIGSAFDAYCKSFLHNELCEHHKQTPDERFNIDNIFNAQVEEPLRDWAKDHGTYIFEQYRSSGALYDLLLEIKRTPTPESVRFEFEVKGAVSGVREAMSTKIGNVILLGKPDMSFTNHEGHQVILDWKVNGYCSPNPASPMTGYVRMRAAGRHEYGSHKQARITMYNGMKINFIHKLNDLNKDWATQLAIYSWLMGNPVGGDAIFAIDQVVCSPNPTVGGLPQLRFAEHRLLIDGEWQVQLFREICNMWDVITSDHIFRDMSYEESKARCAILDEMAEASGDDSPDFSMGSSNTPNYYRR